MKVGNVSVSRRRTGTAGDEQRVEVLNWSLEGEVCGCDNAISAAFAYATFAMASLVSVDRKLGAPKKCANGAVSGGRRRAATKSSGTVGHIHHSRQHVRPFQTFLRRSAVPSCSLSGPAKADPLDRPGLGKERPVGAGCWWVLAALDSPLSDLSPSREFLTGRHLSL